MAVIFGEWHSSVTTENFPDSDETEVGVQLGIVERGVQVLRLRRPAPPVKIFINIRIPMQLFACCLSVLEGQRQSY